MSKQLQVDLEKGTVRDQEKGITYSLGSQEAFSLLSKAWIRSGWDNKYVYGFSWLGRPIIQLPEDIIRIQELLFRVQPTLVIETGVAHGGSLTLYASICKALGKGRVVGVDVDIRHHNRKAIEGHLLSPFITLIEGSSTDQEVVEKVKNEVGPSDTVLVCLDSCHTYAHVRAELEAYAPLVTSGSYLVVMDGIMESLVGAPRSQKDWEWNNPKRAAEAFLEDHPEFVMEEPQFPFNEGNVQDRITYWPAGFLKRY